MGTDFPTSKNWYLTTSDLTLWFKKGIEHPKIQRGVWCYSWQKERSLITLLLQCKISPSQEFNQIVDFENGITIYINGHSCNRSDLFDIDEVLFKIINCKQVRAWTTPALLPYTSQVPVMNCLVKGEIARKF